MSRIDGKYMQQVSAGAWDKAEQWRRQMQQSFGTPPRGHSVSGEAEAMWYGKVAAFDPARAAAMHFTPQGKALEGRVASRLRKQGRL